MARTTLRLGAIIWGIVLAGCAMLGPSPVAALESLTTTHDYAKCPPATSPEPGVIDAHLCQGPAGIAVKWISEPDSSSVDLGSARLQEELGLGSFFEADTSIEWRGPRKGADIAPVAAIVGYSVGRSVSRLDGRRLVVYRLEPAGGSCVMAVVAGSKAGAIARARALADKHAERFKCGTSRRTGG